MAPSGKSRRPPPVRDPRTESVPPIGAPAAVSLRNKPTVSEMRAVSGARPKIDSPLGVSPGVHAQFERLRAARTAEPEQLAAMLVRVAESDKAREAAERKAEGLEAWTVDLEAKVAEARTRGDEIEAAALVTKKELDGAHRELERLRARVTALEGKLTSARREYEDASTVERMRRDLELDSLKEQQRLALSNARGGESESGLASARAAMLKIEALVEDLDKSEAEAATKRSDALESMRRLLASERATDAPTPRASPPARVVDRRAPTTAMPKVSAPRKRSRSSIPVPTRGAQDDREDPFSS